VAELVEEVTVNSSTRKAAEPEVSVWYLLGGSGVTCPSGVVAGVGGFRSPAASAVELLPDDWGVCGPWREPPELAATEKRCYA